MIKISLNCLKYPPGGQGESDQKFFFQKVITHKDATFLGQKFLSKTNILGFHFFLGKNPACPEPLKGVEMGRWGTWIFNFFGQKNFQKL